MATTITTASIAAGIRVNRPRISMTPPKHSTPETNGVRMRGNGMPHSVKFWIICGRLLSFPQPVSMKT